MLDCDFSVTRSIMDSKVLPIATVIMLSPKAATGQMSIIYFLAGFKIMDHILTLLIYNRFK
ncbi:hypothetical protein A946_04005 [Methylacidiphilum kamchatkense Kam1]|uniref:Uncharacterized protein n=1 Tax=Methylacidiphilum kamchatkense Kam1 TaxID=1202785 RepID=A0ABR4ZWX6_9BACT|nr:hypothetical protein A946_04005 [Methylacidiphilum kamchatkense Kam1]